MLSASHLPLPTPTTPIPRNLSTHLRLLWEQPLSDKQGKVKRAGGHWGLETPSSRADCQLYPCLPSMRHSLFLTELLTFHVERRPPVC